MKMHSLIRTSTLVFIAIGLLLGLVYAVGGFFVDLFTIGLNRGTALAFLAIPVMPILFGTVGFVIGSSLAVLHACFRAVFR